MATNTTTTKTNSNFDMNELFKNIVKSDEITYIQYILFGLILIGIILKMFTVSLYSTNKTELEKLQSLHIVPVGPATGSIWGYTIILVACIGLIFIGIKPQETNMEQMKNIPYGLYALIIVLLWNIIINIRFYSSINITRDMPSQYNTWNSWGLVTVILLAVFTTATYFLKIVIPDPKRAENFNYQVNLYMIVVFFIALIVLGIQQSILENFLVAG